MKGISIAIETIIFIILAVTVLTVLLTFFIGTGTGAQTRIEQEQQRNIFCGKYVIKNPTCKSDFDPAPIEDSAKAASICNTLGITKCKDGANSECFNDCCGLFCPRKPATTTTNKPTP